MSTPDGSPRVVFAYTNAFLERALEDCEDADQVAACLEIGADCLVTRNAEDYKGAPVTTHAPGSVLGILSAPRRPPTG